MTIRNLRAALRGRPGRRAVGVLLMAAGVAAMAWYGAESVRAARFQSQQRAVLQNAVAPVLPASAVAVPAATPVAPGGLVGQLDIPRVDLSVMVMEGDDDATLAIAAGHLSDTVLPWDVGNAAIAGHRDTIFRSLKDLHIGDEIRFRTAHGTFAYVVRTLRVVDPDDLSVLAPTDGHALTLVTCYPFYYVGAAPKRFVVRAERLDVMARAEKTQGGLR